MTGSGLAVLSLCDIRKRFQAPSRLLERPARGLIRRPRRNARPARLRQVSISRPRRGCALPLDWCARGGPQRRRSAVARQRQFDKSRRGTDGPAPGTSYCGEIGFVAGRAVSFQITILKVLAGHPDGRASIAELTRYVSILMSSGSDWSDRMRRLSARAPKLEIFADALVLRDDRGWCITDHGRQFLASLEAPIPAHPEMQKHCVTVVAAPGQVQPTLRLVVDNTRASPSGLGPDETRRSA